MPPLHQSLLTGSPKTLCFAAEFREEESRMLKKLAGRKGSGLVF